jgi:hypothetical protein
MQAHDGDEQAWVVSDSSDGGGDLGVAGLPDQTNDGLRRVAITRGREPVLACDASSRNVTSRTQWILFSIDKCPRTL